MIITAEPRSDQWNADDFIGGPITFTIAGVKVGTAEQKYDIELVEGGGRWWRPPLTMLRLLIAAWGKDSTAWKGRRVTLYRDESVRFGSDAVGGIRISHMSHLPGGKDKLTVKLTSTRGRKAVHTVEALPDDAPAPTPATNTKQPNPAAIIKAFSDLGVTVDQLEAHVGSKHDTWTVVTVASLTNLGRSIKAGDTTVEAEFPAEPAADPGEPEPIPLADRITADKMEEVIDALVFDKYETGPDQLDHLTNLLGRTVESIEELTPDEAEKVIAVLTGGDQ